MLDALDKFLGGIWRNRWTALKEGEQNPCENTKDQGILRESANCDIVSLIMYDFAWESLEAPPSTENIHEKQALLEDCYSFCGKQTCSMFDFA